MERLPISFFLLAVVAVTFAGGGVAATEDAPELTVSYEGTTLNGDDTRVTIDPTVHVVARVDADAPDDVTLDRVTVQVNGETRKTYDVGSARKFSRNVTLSLHESNNVVRVIATDSRGEVNSTEFSVYKDGTAPFVELTEPVTDDDDLLEIPDGNASGPRVTFAGKLRDISSVKQVSLRYDDGENYTGGRSVVSPGSNFSVNVTLAKGTNNVRISVEDDLGNSRTYRFEVGVTDDEEPTLTLDVADNQTVEQGWFEVSGRATDNMWVKEVSLSLDERNGNGTISRTLVGSKAYNVSRDRRAATFSDQVLLDFATYDGTVTVTDAGGHNVTKEFTVRRVREKSDVTPRIRFHPDRTQFIADRRLHVSAAVTDGETKRVAIETRNQTSGETVDYVTVHSGDVRDSVDVRAQVDTAAGVSRVIVRAIDGNGTEHTKDFYVNASSEETFVGRDGVKERRPTVTVTPLSTGRNTTASANADVADLDAGETVRIPKADGGDLTSARNVTLSSLSVTASEPTNFTVYVRTTEGGGSIGDDFRAASGATPVAAMTLQHSVADATFQQVVFRFRIDDSYLSTTDVTAENVTLYRKHGGGWNALQTTYTGLNGSSHTFRATSPGLSEFAVGPPKSAWTATQSGTSDANASTGNETNGTSQSGPANETGQTQSADEQASASLRVTNVTLNRTRMLPNQTVGINVTVENTGAAEGTYVAGAAVNGSVVATKAVTVPASNATTVTLTHRIPTTGNYSVVVNGTRGGYVVVERRGLLGSIIAMVTGFFGAIFGFIGGVLGAIFGFVGGLLPGFVTGALAGLPLGLIGMALAGLVAIVVVATVGVQVLERVRGSGESE